jgi:glycosyltransferase involved in cell wall biosynthesis
MPAREDKLLVIVPAFNEQGRVGAVVRSVKSLLPEATLLVVDDCSVDETRAEALRSGAIVISHAVNLGYGAALESGYRWAIQEAYGMVIQMDADGQHLAEEVPALLRPILEDKAELVIGSRYLDRTETCRSDRIKRFGQKLFGFVYSAFTGSRITDPTSGFQCLSRKVVDFYARSDFPSDYPDVNVLLTCYYGGFRIAEVPVQMRPRPGGKSMHSGLQPILYVLKMLLSVLVVILERRRWKGYVP